MELLYIYTHTKCVYKYIWQSKGIHSTDFIGHSLGLEYLNSNSGWSVPSYLASAKYGGPYWAPCDKMEIYQKMYFYSKKLFCHLMLGSNTQN